MKCEEATLFDELLCERVDPEQVHQAVGVRLTRKPFRALFALSLDQVVEEVDSLIAVPVVEADGRDELGKGVCSHVSLRSLLRLNLHVQKLVEHLDAVEVPRRVVALLNSNEELDALSAVFNDAVHQGKAVPNELRVTTDLADRLEEGAHEVFHFAGFLWIVKESALGLGKHLTKVGDYIGGALR